MLSLLGCVVSVSAQTNSRATNQQALPLVLNTTPHFTLTAKTAAAPNPAEMTLGNLDRAVGIALPTRPYYFHLDQPVFVETVEEIMHYEQRIRDVIDQGSVLTATGEIIDISSGEAIDILGRIIEQSDLPLSLGEASGLLVRNVGDAIGSASGLLQDAPDNPYPLTSALDYATGGLADASDLLFQNDSQLQRLQGSPGSNLLSGSGPSTGLLTPVANLLSGLNVNMSTDSLTNNGLLAPVNQLVAGLTGAVPTAYPGHAGVQQSVTGLVGPLLNSPPALSVNGVAASNPINMNSATTAHHNSLLAPVTGLINGLLGAPPR